MITPNIFAWLMLSIWPLVALVLYRHISAERALIWTILGGYLLLPPLAAFDLAMVPDMTKDSIPALAALVMALFVLRDRISFVPGSLVGKGLIALFVLGPFATVLTNSDALVITHDLNAEVQELAGLRIYDSVAAVANQAIALLPFFLARHYLASAQAMRAIIVALVVAGLAYSIPMLIEIRLSPQMNVWVYGYFQHDFFQTIRFGGYRPVVFLPHGLWVAFFALMAVLSSLMLLRVGPSEDRPRYLAAAIYLTAVLVLSKSTGVLFYALIFAPLILLLGRRGILLLAAALAVVAISYPLLRGAQLVPMEALLNIADGIDPERASSLRFRFENEQVLLAHANEKWLFGWGGYGRNHVYDLFNGNRLTIADGAWIITMGVFGWFGYIAQFGLLALPLILLGREALSARGAAFSPFACAVALILAANMMDMLPNATLIPFTWLLAGALLGHAEALAAERRAAAIVAAHVRPPRRTVL